MMHRILVAVLFLLASNAGLEAQQRRAPLDPGSRVRVSAPGVFAAPVTGTVVAADADWLQLASADPAEKTWVRLRFVDEVEVSRGTARRQRTWKGSSWGAFLGFGMGVIAGALASKELPTTTGQSVALGGLGVGLVGGGIGAAIGAAIPARERWQGYVMSHAVAPPLTR